jgi:hypothetical protein
VKITPGRRGAIRLIGRPLNLPPEVAHGFVDAVNDYFAEEDPIKRDAIAAHQLSVLGQYQNPREGKLRLSDIKAMFEAMKGIVG